MRFILPFIVVLSLLPYCVQAQDIGPGTDYVEWTTRVVPVEATAGDTVAVILHARISPGWKMYALDSPRPTRGVQWILDLAKGQGETGEIVQFGQRRGYDPNFSMEVSYYEEEARLERRVVLSDGVGAGAQTIAGRVVFMVCNDRLCLPPARLNLSAGFRIR
jgi:DsbC/DsbD-like thiol-disulfide interchange protein